MEEKFFDLLFDLRLAEKRILRIEEKTKKEEDSLHDRMVDSLREGDREAAKDYAKMLLRLRKRRKTIRKYLSRVKDAKARVREASASRSAREKIIKTAKTFGKMKDVSSYTELIKATEELEREEVHLPPRKPSVQEGNVENLLDQAQLEVETETEEILPKIPDKETLKQEEKEKEEEE